MKRKQWLKVLHQQNIGMRRTTATRLKMQESQLGKKSSTTTRQRISSAMKKQWKTGERISHWLKRGKPTGLYKFPKGNIPWNSGKTGLKIGWPKGTKFTKRHKRNLSIARTNQKWSEQQRQKYLATIKKLGGYAAKLAYKRIKKEIPNLEKQGFRCIPIYNVIPDIIGIKDGKVYAIEVEYGKPNYRKYRKNNYRSYFKNVIWLLRKK